jgi:hypothetical protein
MEYARFGSELIATGRRFRGKSLLPDAEILPVDAVKVTVLSPDVTGTFVTEGLSLQYAASGSNGDTCFAVIARDTDRFLQSNCTVRFSSAGEEVIPDRPSAYCDTVVCLTPPGAGVEVFPNPFVIANDADDSVRIVATLNGRPPVSTILDIYSLNGISIHHSVSSTTGFEGSSAVAWNGRDDTGKPVESGEYVYTLLVDGALKVGKIVVVRK